MKEKKAKSTGFEGKITYFEVNSSGETFYFHMFVV